MLALHMLLYYRRMRYQGHSFVLLLCAALAGAAAARPDPNPVPNSNPPSSGLAAWCGDELRGKTMANGQPFDPDQLTAASWFYALGTQLRVSLVSTSQPPRSVIVKVTDRGPRRDLVKQGRIIDLSQAAFRKLAPLELGLVPITVEQLTNAPSPSPSKPESHAEPDSAP